MSYGVKIEYGVSDWQVFQHHKGTSTIHLGGVWEEIEGFSERRTVMVRVVRERDNQQIIPWMEAENQTFVTPLYGHWDTRITIPSGGLYRIETSLDIGNNNRATMRRGDIRFHIGVGNLFIIAGQSNSAGYGRGDAWDPPTLGVAMYRNMGRWDLASHPINDPTNAFEEPNIAPNTVGTSPYLAFGRLFQEISGMPVGLIPTSLGNTPLSRWEKGGDLYQNMIRRLEKIGGHIAGVLWYQGCSDTGNPELFNSYGMRFAKMVRDFRELLKYEVPFFTFQLNMHTNSQNQEGWAVVKEAQRVCGTSLPRVYVLPTHDCAISDNIHNNSVSNVLLGERLARQAAYRICGGLAYDAPNITKAVCVEKKLTLTFSNVRFGFELHGHTPGYGFVVTDELGVVDITSWTTSAGTLTLDLMRELGEEAYVSFETGTNPGKQPISDTVTYMPPLCFYRLSIEK